MPPARQQDKAEDYELGPELWPAWQVFTACWNQWRITVGFADLRYEGIEYPALESVIRLHGIPRKKQRDVFWAVQVMENEAKPLRNKK